MVDADIDIEAEANAVMAAAVIVLTNPLDGVDESLTIDLPALAAIAGGAITVGGSSTATSLVLTGLADAADYEAALKLVRYENASENPTETNRLVEITVTDALQGDSNTATAEIAVTASDDGALPGGGPFAIADDLVFTNEAGDLALPSAFLLFNDSDGFEITGVGNASAIGATVELDGDEVDLTGPVESFEYAAAFFGDLQTADVTVVRDAGGTLTGDGVLDSILLAAGGNDSLLGGSGDDILLGSAGADILTGGLGSDLFVLAAGDGGPALGDADIITDFADGTDLVGLLGGLDFADLTLDDSLDQGLGDALTADTVISITSSAEVLAVVQDTTGLTSDDFDSLVVP